MTKDGRTTNHKPWASRLMLAAAVVGAASILGGCASPSDVTEPTAPLTQEREGGSPTTPSESSGMPEGYPSANGPDDVPALHATWAFLAENADAAVLHSVWPADGCLEGVPDETSLAEVLNEIVDHPEPERIDGLGEDRPGTAKVHHIADYEEGDPDHPDGGENYFLFQYADGYWRPTCV